MEKIFEIYSDITIAMLNMIGCRREDYRKKQYTILKHSINLLREETEEYWKKVNNQNE